MQSSQAMILIVEDEQKLAQVLCEYLATINLATHWIENGLEVLPWIRANNPDLILLDLMLPGKDGLSIFRELKTFSDIPVMMVTAKIDEIDRLIGLELGADDYICKPYSPREVVARVKNLLRRTSKKRPLANGCQIALDNLAMSAKLNGKTFDITPREFRLLQQLSKHVNRVYSRAQLLDCLYDDHRIVTDRTVDSHIKNLRKKMNAIAPDCDVIKSIYGVGYKLEI